jgi:hypothetical protein
VRKRAALGLLLLASMASSAAALDWKDFSGEKAPAESPWKEFDAPASPEEMTALGVDAELAEMMRNRTGGQGTLLRGADRDAPIGIQWPIESTGSVKLVQQLRAELGKRGLVVFVADRSYGTGPDHVAIVRASEPIEVVATRIASHGKDARLAKLRAWHAEAAWDLLGAGEDWVEIEFREPLANPEHWVAEIIAVAPPVGDGADSRVALREMLVRTRRALLWWSVAK